MIRFRLKEMLAEKGFQENRRVTLDEVAKATGIHRTTLSKIANQRGYNTGTEQIDRLCAYFDCRVEEIIEYVPMNEQPE
ncbi:helix-turn-helix domain-containing protein [Halomonas piscis]|uniref:helix-turn-helix domain-containing protein n=1 Tax=Halomonas piscis TaxID=3031727 RepID=UPI00289A54A1|nr:helix-turn-helix transcriptional regulator [Halomonas piscis]